MKLIKLLDARKIKKKWRRFALFHCGICGHDVERIKETGLRNKTCGCMTKHGMNGTRLYYTWGNLISRCINENNDHYKHYGGRGIKLCDEWMYFENFKNWALTNGYQDNLQIDRIDNNGNYERGNIEFMDPHSHKVLHEELKRRERNEKYVIERS